MVLSTVNEKVVTNMDGLKISSLMPYNMEEPDQRILIQVKHASRARPRIMIKTIDSDVVVRTIANFHQLVPLNELWIEFGAAT